MISQRVHPVTAIDSSVSFTSKPRPTDRPPQQYRAALASGLCVVLEGCIPLQLYPQLLSSGFSSVVVVAVIAAGFPRNVDPQHNGGRRRARFRAILDRTDADRESNAFVDVAQYGNSFTLTIAVVDGNGTLGLFASVKTTASAKAEKIAAAIAMVDHTFTYVLTDSRGAIPGYESGSVSKVAAHILLSSSKESK
ncbi:hypothetical protein HPB50_023310 [Hyalomma asiaticum]|uniref:Uncharacterized protein n=1 Tax=Hyalomma asiaticum TaxID=266040 RepID=A0ACB7TQE3_HYAAI|nr:hypothetical protein HPB50_023310 [Hyalomma asiaticum]